MAKKKNSKKSGSQKTQDNQTKADNDTTTTSTSTSTTTTETGRTPGKSGGEPNGTAGVVPPPDESQTDASVSDGPNGSGVSGESKNEENSHADVVEREEDSQTSASGIAGRGQTDGETGGDGGEQRVKELEAQVALLTLELEKTHRRGDEKEKEKEDDEVNALKDKLKETEEAKEKVEGQYEALLGRLGSMKTLFSKMKENEAALEEAQEQIEDYERSNLQLKQKADSLQKEKSELEKTNKLLKESSEGLNLECDRLSQDLRNLREESEERENTWQSEKNSLSMENHKLLREVNTLKESNEEYLITLENNKMVNQSLNNEITSLNDKIEDLQSAITKLQSENKAYLSQNDTLQSKLTQLQASHKKTHDQQIVAFKSLEEQLELQKGHNTRLQEENDTLKEQSGKVIKLEEEIRNKQLQIGKLRHEAVILNEHLTKALQLIKRNSDSETVDKELVTNLFISFLSIPRGDAKKFEVLQLISNFLNWDDDKKIQAGLSHNATSSRRQQARESFVSLWTEYLEKEST